jgi:hypothetical protein
VQTTRTFSRCIEASIAKFLREFTYEEMSHISQKEKLHLGHEITSTHIGAHKIEDCLKSGIEVESIHPDKTLACQGSNPDVAKCANLFQPVV